VKALKKNIKFFEIFRQVRSVLFSTKIKFIFDRQYNVARSYKKRKVLEFWYVFIRHRYYILQDPQFIIYVPSDLIEELVVMDVQVISFHFCT
jgi:hypothetical protein